MRVVGIDLSLTATGLAAVDDTVGIVTVGTAVVKSKPDDGTLSGRYRRLETIASRVVGYASGAELVVIEGPSYSSSGRGTWDRAGLWWWVVSVLHLTQVALVEVPPTTRAKWSTDRGNAGKAAVAVAVGRMWPEVQLTDDNDSDALALATIGAQLVGIDVPSRAWQKSALAKLVVHGEGIQRRIRDV